MSLDRFRKLDVTCKPQEPFQLLRILDVSEYTALKTLAIAGEEPQKARPIKYSMELTIFDGFNYLLRSSQIQSYRNSQFDMLLDSIN